MYYFTRNVLYDILNIQIHLILGKIMKKILLTIVSIGLMSSSYAATSPAVLTLTGTLNSSCTSVLTTPNLSFTLIPNQASTPATTNYNLTCTAGTIISSITATSTNTWKLVEPNSGDDVPYVINASAFSANYTGVLPAVWSGSTAMTTLTTGAFTINNAAAPVLATLSIEPDVTPIDANIGTYSDSVTILTTF